MGRGKATLASLTFSRYASGNDNEAEETLK